MATQLLLDELGRKIAPKLYISYICNITSMYKSLPCRLNHNVLPLPLSASLIAPPEEVASNRVVALSCFADVYLTSAFVGANGLSGI